jgi:histidyl-tRNA synthetase
MNYMGRSMKAQMKDANRENARFAIIVGDNELNEGKFTFRNMNASEEYFLTIDEILKKLGES